MEVKYFMYNLNRWDTYAKVHSILNSTDQLGSASYEMSKKSLVFSFELVLIVAIIAAYSHSINVSLSIGILTAIILGISSLALRHYHATTKEYMSQSHEFKQKQLENEFKSDKEFYIEAKELMKTTKWYYTLCKVVNIMNVITLAITLGLIVVLLNSIGCDVPHT